MRRRLTSEGVDDNTEENIEHDDNDDEEEREVEEELSDVATQIGVFDLFGHVAHPASHSKSLRMSSVLTK